MWTKAPLLAAGFKQRNRAVLYPQHFFPSSSFHQSSLAEWLHQFLWGNIMELSHFAAWYLNVITWTIIISSPKNTWSWGHCPIILVCWHEFWMIKWFCKLSDTYQEVRKGHKQEGAECASCWPAAFYRADSLYHRNWHTHAHTHTKRQECFSTEGEADCQERQSVRADNIKTVCPCYTVESMTSTPVLQIILQHFTFKTYSTIHCHVLRAFLCFIYMDTYAYSYINHVIS